MTSIVIDNMTCGGCAKGVTATLREAAPGREPRFDLEQRRVEVEGEMETLLAALRADGWQARPAG